jgi:hypothetical protein
MSTQTPARGLFAAALTKIVKTQKQSPADALQQVDR